MTTEQIKETIQKHCVRFVHLQFSDLLGMLKAVTVPVQQLSDVLKHGKWFDGSSIEGFARIAESDMFLMPDLSTFRIIPWSRNNGCAEARIICDVYKPGGEPFYGDPRYILKRQIERARKMGFEYFVAP